MEEDLPGLPTNSAEVGDNEVLKGQSPSNKNPGQGTTSVSQSEDAVLQKQKDFEELSCDVVPQIDDHNIFSESRPGTFVFSVQPEKRNPDDKVGAIYSDRKHQEEEKTLASQTELVNPEQNTGIDKVPTESVSNATAYKMQDDDLPVVFTTKAPSLPESHKEIIIIPDQPDQHGLAFTIVPDMSPSEVRKVSNKDEESSDDVVITHITKASGKFDNIFEAMSSDIELRSDNENSNSDLQTKRPEVIYATSSAKDFQCNPDKTLEEATSLKDNSGQNVKANTPSTFRDTFLKSDKSTAIGNTNAVKSGGCNQTSLTDFQSVESVFSEIDKMCDQVNMADDSNNSSPWDADDFVSAAVDSNQSNSQDFDKTPDRVHSASEPEKSNTMADIQNTFLKQQKDFVPATVDSNSSSSQDLDKSPDPNSNRQEPHIMPLMEKTSLKQQKDFVPATVDSSLSSSQDLDKSPDPNSNRQEPPIMPLMEKTSLKQQKDFAPATEDSNPSSSQDLDKSPDPSSDRQEPHIMPLMEKTSLKQQKDFVPATVDSNPSSSQDLDKSPDPNSNRQEPPIMPLMEKTSLKQQKDFVPATVDSNPSSSQDLDKSPDPNSNRQEPPIMPLMEKTSLKQQKDFVPATVESNLSNSQDIAKALSPVNSVTGRQRSHAIPDIESSDLEKTKACHKTDIQYSLSSEAERQEEIMAMQRDLYGDELEENVSILQQSSADLSYPLSSISSSKEKENSETAATKSSSPLLRIKEEPMDYEEYPSVINRDKAQNDSCQKSPETCEGVDAGPVDSREHLMSEVLSLNNSHTLLNLASKHLESMSAVVGEESVVVENVGTTEDQAKARDDETQNFIKSLETAELECIIVNDRAKYKPPKIPPKLKDNFPKGPFTCYACADSFLFKSSLYSHLNRKCVQIMCKNNQCLNSGSKTEFFNKCSYFIHCKQHEKKSGPNKFEASCASDDILQDITDMAELPSSQAYLSDFKRSLSFSWTCTECSTEFDNAMALASHFVPSHEGLQGSQCDICKKHFYTKCALSAHKRTHSEDKPYVCPECGQLFLGSWEAFSKHLNMKCFHTFRQPSLTCPKCSITGSSYDKMTQHLLCHKEVYLKCQKCPMAFKAFKNIKNHMRNTHSIEDESFSYAQVFKCSTCDTVFHNLNHLTIHTSKHIEQFNKAPKYHFKCWLCPNMFDNRIGIERHLSKQHRVKPCKVLCDICGCHFESMADLLTHLENNECLKLSDSPNSLSAKGTLKPGEPVVKRAQLQQQPRLQKSKTKIKAKKSPVLPQDTSSYFICGVCEFKCTKANISEINSHIRKHRTDGVYLCSICLTAVYDTFTDLHRHQFLCRKKKAEKKGSPSKDNAADARSCKKCSVCFLTDTSLTEHLQTAHGIGPQFPCHLCGLTYDTQHSLHQHIQLVHEGKKHLYLCWICQSKNLKRTFTTAPKLERHLVAKHRVPRNIIDPEKFPRLLPGINQKDTIVDRAPQPENEESHKQVPIKRLKLANDTLFRCAKCEFSTEKRDEFEVHIKVHKTESTSRQCPECGLCFSVLPSLKKHLIMVHKIKDISTYVRTSGLDEAQYVEPPAFAKSPNSGSLPDTDSNNPLECRVCYKNFDSEVSLKTHMRTHGMAFIRSKRTLTSFPSHTPETK